MDDTAEKPEGFHITDESSADWLLRKLLHLDAEEATVREMAAQRVAELQADKNRLMGRFGAELEAWARTEAEKRRRQTVTLSYGSVSFRKVPARLAIESEEDAITTARAVLPEAIQAVEKFDRAAYLAHAKTALETTGELLPGVGQTEERVSFSVKFGTKSKGTAPVEEPTD